MRPVSLLVVMIACAACTATPPPPRAAAPLRAQAPPDDRSPVTPTLEPAPSWRWTSFSEMPPTPAIAKIVTVWTTSYDIEQRGDRIVVRADESRDSEPDYVSLPMAPAPKVVMEPSKGRTLAVLRFGGATTPTLSLHHLDRREQPPLWETTLEALRLDEAQLRFEGDRLLVHTRRDEGSKAVAVVEASSGTQLGVHRVSGALAGLQLLSIADDSPPAPTRPIAITHALDDGGRLTIEGPTPHQLEVARLGAQGQLMWSTQLNWQAPGDHLVTRVDDGVVLLGHHHLHTTGAALQVVDLGTGTLRWRRMLDGIGPVAHSAYRNRVALRIVEGHAIALGDESLGRYIEARSLDTGDLALHHRERVNDNQLNYRRR